MVKGSRRVRLFLLMVYKGWDMKFLGRYRFGTLCLSGGRGFGTWFFAGVW
jgi:hypothetical protein